MTLPSVSGWSSGSGSSSSSSSTGSQPVNSTNAGLKVLPPVDWTKSGVVDKGTLDSTATSASESQLPCAADNAFIRTVYGEYRLGAQVANVAVYQGKWVIQVVWCEGGTLGIEGIVAGSAQINDQPMPVGVTATHYYGTSTQIVDPTMAAAIPGYSDALHGIAYSVFQIPADAVSGEPNINAVVRGIKLYDPRTGLTVWSDNPALALADFQSRIMGRTMDWTSVGAAADACDELVGGEKRRLIGLAMEEPQECSAWVDTLRTYAGCWNYKVGNAWQLIPDRPRATDAIIRHADGQIKSIAIKKRGVRNVPTYLKVGYTNTSQTPWFDDQSDPAVASDPAYRLSEIPLPGIHRKSQANREALERLKKLWMCDVSVDLEVFDEGLKLCIGDVVSVSHPFGFTDKLLRVLGIEGDYGRFRLSLTEYDPAVYSDATSTEPTYPDTTYPNPLNPPAPTGLTLVEEVFEKQTGIYASRIKVTWEASSFIYITDYRVEVYDGTKLVYATVTDKTEVRSPEVQELVTYTVKVATVSSVGDASAWAQDTISALGKYLIPTDVPSIACFEVGGRVHISWAASTDVDIWRYEIRYWPVGESWASPLAKTINIVDALHFVYDQVPHGTWVVGVKAIDSVGQSSVNAATATVVVTTDASAFLVDTFQQTSPTLTNMVAFTLAPWDTNAYAVTDSGGTAASLLAGATLAAYTNPLSTYHASCTSTWLGESDDVGQQLGGQWTITADVTDVSGSHNSYLGLAQEASPTTWVYHSGLSQKENGRFCRAKHEALTTATMLVAQPNQTIRIDAIPRVEVGTFTTSATAGVTITLENEYIACKRLTLTLEGNTARSASYDNIQMGPPTTFDVHGFNTVTGARIASAGRYEWEGV